MSHTIRVSRIVGGMIKTKLNILQYTRFYIEITKDKILFGQRS